MLIDLYDQQGDWNAYQTSLQVYIDHANMDTYQPIVMMVVPDPNGEPHNTVKVELTPYSDYLDTTIANYRPEEIVKVQLHSKLTGFEFKIYYSTRE